MVIYNAIQSNTLPYTTISYHMCNVRSLAYSWLLPTGRHDLQSQRREKREAEHSGVPVYIPR
ncbi:hypothetical protein KUCAC02_008911 [Chaenocephalus aceratus]|uniref:Uncharacterized protein n=1 Tax=Chaenocephalus aceratus TaxID=36190 RepID=A0ACB9WSW9_CHAAC|nr:hypothetical protein KUCAC02_008911 [Chaenocephalus aceratus]